MNNQKGKKIFERGITLVALVVTIIVLLILAGITIQLVLGENGIIGKARDSKKVMNEAQIKEELQLAIHALQPDYHTGNNTGTFRDYIFSTAQGKGQEKLKAELGANNISFNASTYIITYKGLEFSISDDGTVTKVGESANHEDDEEPEVDFDSIIAEIPTKYNEYLAEAQEKGQTISQDIGIGTDGNVLNLDLWNYATTDDGTGITLGYYDGCVGTAAYKGTIVNGSFDGGIPTYIYSNSTISTLPVKILEEYGWNYSWFENNGAEDIEYIFIPKTITSISLSASNYQNLTRINVAKGNTTLDSRNNCNAIINTESDTLISGCANSTIPNGIKAIGFGAFNNCTGITNIVIPNSVETISDYAFYNLTGLTSLEIPNSVVSIGNNSFKGCSNLQNLKIDLTEIPEKMFWYSRQLTNLNIGNNVKKIGNDSFSNCSGLTNLSLGANIETIGDSAFLNCSNIASLVIPNNVVSIGSGAFYRCTGLVNLSLGTGITSIGWVAFYNCSCLTRLEIPNNVETIGDSAFCECTELESLSLGASVRSIGNNAFKECKNITNLVIPSSVESIGDSAFCSCTGLTRITIPGNVKTIGERAFKDCISAEAIDLNEGIESIGDYAFFRSSSLNAQSINSIVIPSSVVNMGIGISFGRRLTLCVVGKSERPITWDSGWHEIAAYSYNDVTWNYTGN